MAVARVQAFQSKRAVARFVLRSKPVRVPLQRCYGLSDVRKYLEEALEHVFSTETSTAPFKESSFSGPITHDDHARLRKIYQVVQSTPRATDPLEAEPSEEEVNKQKRWLQGALEKVFSSKTESGTEKEWVVQPFEGKITSKREIERLLYVERVVKQAMEKAEQK